MTETAAKNGSLPDKIYFRIGEVSDIVGVEPYVLRYWESEFATLRPSKSSSRQRLYRKSDVELLLKIKKLLYEDMFTIAGAKKQLSRLDRKNRSSQLDLHLSPDVDQILQRIESELDNLLHLVAKVK